MLVNQSVIESLSSANERIVEINKSIAQLKQDYNDQVGIIAKAAKELKLHIRPPALDLYGDVDEQWSQS